MCIMLQSGIRGCGEILFLTSIRAAIATAPFLRLYGYISILSSNQLQLHTIRPLRAQMLLQKLQEANSVDHPA